MPERVIEPAAADVDGMTVPVNEDDRIQRLRALYEQQKASGEETGAIDAELIHDLVLAGKSLRDRVKALEEQAGRALVVDELPPTADLGLLFRLRGDQTGALYLGNGPSRPLSKLLPQTL